MDVSSHHHLLSCSDVICLTSSKLRSLLTAVSSGLMTRRSASASSSPGSAPTPESADSDLARLTFRSGPAHQSAQETQYDQRTASCGYIVDSGVAGYLIHVNKVFL